MTSAEDVPDGGAGGRDVAPVDGGAGNGGTLSCLVAADCDNGNPCSTFRCPLSAGEIGNCEYTPVTDGTACSVGSCAGTCAAGICRSPACADSGVMQPLIDPACPSTCPYSRLTPAFPAPVPLAPDDVPAGCTQGFQLGGVSGGCGVAVYSLDARATEGASARTLDVDFATYLVPDGVTITALDAGGVRHTLLRLCRLQTWYQGGPSNMRPPDESIRQFRLALPRGTTRLEFDFGPVTSPMYLRVVGLCDFDVTPFAHASFWEALP